MTNKSNQFLSVRYTGMTSRGRGTFPNRGRGGTFPYRGRGGQTLAQHGTKRLIAENISSSSSSNNLTAQDLKDFTEWQKSRGKTQEANASYATVASEETEDKEFPYEQNTQQEIILLLSNNDLRWKNNIWQIMDRYLDVHSFQAGTYKQRLNYECMLSSSGSVEFNHFQSPNKDSIAFSKAIIKQIISVEDWGISPLKEREYYIPQSKTPGKYNYWDYIEAFNKAFLYQNKTHKHTWFFKVCTEVYKKEIPQWFYQWWISYGPSVKILPETYKELYSEWVKISPALIEAEHDNMWVEGMPSLHFFSEFGIPWILKWEPEMGYTSQNIPCIKRNFYTRFWKKMLKAGPNGDIEGQATLDNITETIEKYTSKIKSQQQREAPSPFGHISRRIKNQLGTLSKAEIVAAYVEQMKKDLQENLQKSDTSMQSSSSNLLPEDSQDPYENEEEMPLADLIKQAEENLHKEADALQKQDDKGKGALRH